MDVCFVPKGGEDDPFQLCRFVEAQQACYAQILAELRRARKRSHWMWFVFPQLAGLGTSSTARFFAIGGIDEAVAYLEHPLLGARLGECCEILTGLAGHSAVRIFGSVDTMKLCSSMTLFEQASGAGSVFTRVLDAYFAGHRDDRTLALLQEP